MPLPSNASAPAAIQRVEHELARSAAQEATDRHHAAREIATAATKDAVASAYPPIEAAALLARGRLEAQDGDLAAAEATSTTAADTAAGAHDDASIGAALVELVRVLTSKSRAATARSGDRRLEAELLGNVHPATAVTRANICYSDATAGKLTEARACQEKALVTRRPRSDRTTPRSPGRATRWRSPSSISAT